MLTRRIIIISILSISLAATIYSLSWFLFANSLIRSAENWVNNQAKSGLVINFSDIQKKGFPGRPKFLIKKIETETPYLRNFLLLKDEVLITPSSYKPIQLDIEASGMSMFRNKTDESDFLEINANQALINFVKKEERVYLILSAENIKIINNNTQSETNIGLVNLNHQYSYEIGDREKGNQYYKRISQQNLEIRNLKTGLFREIQNKENNFQIHWILKDKLSNKRPENLYEIINNLSKNESVIKIKEMMIKLEPIEIYVNGEIAFDYNLQPISDIKISIKGINQAIDILGTDDNFTMGIILLINLIFPNPKDIIKTTLTIKNQKLWIGSNQIISIPKIHWKTED